MRMSIGTVKWFDAVKGYGFIEMANEADVFVHASRVLMSARPLTKGMAVRFNITLDPADSSRRTASNVMQREPDAAPATA